MKTDREVTLAVVNIFESFLEFAHAALSDTVHDDTLRHYEEKANAVIDMARRHEALIPALVDVLKTCLAHMEARDACHYHGDTPLVAEVRAVLAAVDGVDDQAPENKMLTIRRDILKGAFVIHSTMANDLLFGYVVQHVVKTWGFLIPFNASWDAGQLATAIERYSSHAGAVFDANVLRRFIRPEEGTDEKQ